jgi:hypothetical protein
MPLCAYGGHRCAEIAAQAYYTVPGKDRFTADRYRLRVCVRHFRQLLAQLYRCGLDLLTEDDEPEFCVGCGKPAQSVPLEMTLYQQDVRFVFALVACDDCDCTKPSVVNQALVAGEKLPPRENMTNRSSKKRG